MNEESHNSNIEPELEARIIAMVLGEASDFEREELKRLIELRPELAAFELRMHRVHGLLQDVGEGEFEVPSEDWKLPADKRNAVLAAIRGEATVHAVTHDDNTAIPQQAARKRSWLWSLVGGTAVVCVVGIVASLRLTSFNVNEMASSEYFAEMLWVDERYDRRPVPDGSRLHGFDVDRAIASTEMPQGSESMWGRTNLHFGSESKSDGVVPNARWSESALPNPNRRHSSWFIEDGGKKSEIALSAIQDTLDTEATLPSDTYLDDDVQYFKDGPEFKLSLDAAQQFAREQEELGLSEATTEPAAASTPQAVDSPELIARNNGTWMYRAHRDEDRNGDGQADSQPNAPNVALRRLALPIPPDAFEDSSVAAIRLRTDVADRDKALLGAISDLSATAGEASGGEPDAPVPEVARELKELNATGTVQEFDAKAQTLSLADVAQPNEESKKIGSFATRDFGAQTSGTEKGQGQHHPQQGQVAGREYSNNLWASPANESRSDSERFKHESAGTESDGLVATIQPADEAADKSVDRFFGRGGLGLGRTAGESATGNGGFGGGGMGGGGGGFGVNHPFGESNKEIQADANGSTDEKMEGIARYDDSGLNAQFLSKAPATSNGRKSRLAVEVPVIDGFSSSLPSASKWPPDQPAPVNDLERLGEAADTDEGRKRFQRKNDAKPGSGGVAVAGGMAQDNRESASIQMPTPRRAAGTWRIESAEEQQSPGTYFNGSAFQRDNLPSKVKERQVELQRNFGEDAIRQYSKKSKAGPGSGRSGEESPGQGLAGLQQNIAELKGQESVLKSELTALNEALRQGGQRDALLLLGGKPTEGTVDETPDSAEESVSSAKTMFQAMFPLLMEETLLTEQVGSDHPKLVALKKRIELTRDHFEELAGMTPKRDPTDQTKSPPHRDYLAAYINSLQQELQVRKTAREQLQSLANAKAGELNTAKRSAPSAGLNEKTAAEEAFSTFSLHVSDVSFKLAYAALGRGEWPEVAKVRIEEFVNAFDYGDPMPINGEKVACRVEQSIHPFVQQRNLLRVSMRTAAAGRASTTPLRLTFLLDNSGSMERIDRQQTVRRAFAMLAQQLTPIDQVTLISFARQPRLLADKVGGAEAGKLVQLIDKRPSEGGTNIEAALQLAFEKAREQQTPNAQNRIILLTDGAVNLGNADPESLSQMVTTMRSSGIAFDAAGISAEGLNDEVLEALTRKGDGRYYLLDSIEDADGGFARQIAGALRPSAKNVKVQIEFNPKRVGRYKLLGFEKHVLKKEDFRNDKVDAAEMAAAEAGVAMYQFEALPDGEGDVGSVSVRFRDLSTGQMIENRWPIPYEADAPRVDQAAPSLRIAASAALLAAKLKGEPLGESVDLQALSHLMSGLPAAERNNQRVQQLQQMIEQARQLSAK